MKVAEHPSYVLQFAAASVAGSLLIAALTASMARGQTTYIGAHHGDWGNSANWSAGVPHSGLSAVLNASTALVNVNLGPHTSGHVANLTIDTGDSLTVQNNTTLNAYGSISGGGNLLLAPGINVTTFNLYATGTLSGAGVIDMANGTSGGYAQINGNNSQVTLNKTIRGGGYIWGGVRLDVGASGIVEANLAARELYWDFWNGSGVTSLGTLRSVNGATLTLSGESGGPLDSTGGSIQAHGAGSIVRLVYGATITSGVLSTTGGGEIVTESGHSARISPSSLSGTYRARNNTRTWWSGTLNNSGNIYMSPAANHTYMTIDAPLTLNGSGTLHLEAGSGGSAQIDGNGSLLTNSASHTIRGTGYLGAGGVPILNSGVIRADIFGAGLYIDAQNAGSSVTFTNNNLVEATGGGSVTYAGDSGGAFAQGTTGITRAVGTGSVVQIINGAVLTGGTLTTSGGGLVQVAANHVATISTLTNSGAFELQNNVRMFVNGAIHNTGSFTLKPGPNHTYWTLGSNVTLNGSGALVMNTGSGAYAQVDGNNSLLTNTATHTIRGSGYLGAGSVVIINHGLIEANAGPGTGLYIDAQNNGADNTFTNNNVARATAGSTLSYAGENGGRFIQGPSGVTSATGAGSIFQILNGAYLSGGSITTASSGIARLPANHTATLDGLTLTTGSKFDSENNTRLYLANTITNNGSITVSPAANHSYVSMSGTVTLQGSGDLQLLPSGSSGFASIDSGQLINGASHLIHGTGNLSAGSTVITNNGTIRADVSGGGLYFDAQNDGVNVTFTNNNIAEATNGGILYYAGENGGRFTQAPTAVTRAVGAGSAVELRNLAYLEGGSLSTSGAGLIRVGTTNSGTAAVLGNIRLTSGSNLLVSAGNRLYAYGTIENNGTMTFGEGSHAYLDPESSVAFTGAGSIVFASNQDGTAQITGGGDVTFGAGQTVRGSGSLGAGSTVIVNHGTIHANVPGSASIFGGLYIDAQNNGSNVTFTNNGTLRASNGATLYLAGESGGYFGGVGPIVVDVGSFLESRNSAVGNLGPVTGSGLVSGQSSSNMGYQSIRGPAIDAQHAGTVRISAGGGNTGTSKVSGLTISNGGRVDVTDHALIVDYNGASPIATIRGYLAAGYNGGNWNGAAGINSSVVTSTNNRSIGYAEASDILGVGGGAFYGQGADGTAVLVLATLAGDTNLDRVVNFTDLVALARNYEGGSGKVWRDGDVTYDGLVNFTDLLALARSYGGTFGGAEEAQLTAMAGEDFVTDWTSARAAVPEPMVLGLISGGLTLGLRRSRRMPGDAAGVGNRKD